MEAAVLACLFQAWYPLFIEKRSRNLISPTVGFNFTGYGVLCDYCIFNWGNSPLIEGRTTSEGSATLEVSPCRADCHVAIHYAYQIDTFSLHFVYSVEIRNRCHFHIVHGHRYHAFCRTVDIQYSISCMPTWQKTYKYAIRHSESTSNPTPKHEICNCTFIMKCALGYGWSYFNEQTVYGVTLVRSEPTISEITASGWNRLAWGLNRQDLPCVARRVTGYPYL